MLDYIRNPSEEVLREEVDTIAKVNPFLTVGDLKNEETKKLMNELIVKQLRKPETIKELTHRMKDELTVEQSSFLIDTITNFYEKRKF